MDQVTNSPSVTSQPTSDQTQPMQQTPPPTPTQTPSKKNNTLFLGIVAIVIIILGMAIIFMVQKPTTPSSAPVVTPTVAVQELSPTSAPTTTEEKEIDAVDTASDSSDLKDVQNDINQL